MQESESKPFKLRQGALTKILMAVAAITLLQGCGGSPPVGVFPAPSATLQAIKLSPTTPLLPLAGVRQLTATGVYSDGTQQNLTEQVTWSVSPAPGVKNTNSLAVISSGASAGTVSGMNLGSGVVTASVGSTVGLLQLIVNANGFTSSTTGISVVPSGSREIDVAYQPRSQSMVQGAYVVQVVNLDADQFSSVLPVPAAVIASIPMPSGFVPNATAVSANTMKAAVISYSSNQVQIVDASNDPTDPASNTIVATFAAPVPTTQTVSFNGITCVICAALVYPTSGALQNDILLLSTASGYYTMDLTAGTFTALAPGVCPAPSFSINPAVAAPYLLSPNPGRTSQPDPSCPSEVQIVNLNVTGNAITGNLLTTSSFGLTAPNAATIDPSTNFSAIVDGGANNQLLIDLTVPQSPASSLFSNLGLCLGQVGGFNMVASGVSPTVDPTLASRTYFLSRTSGNCIGFEVPAPPGANPPFPNNTQYGYGPMPVTPDTVPFMNGTDPNAIATFNSVVDKKNYVVLVDGNPSANQNWMAKISPKVIFSGTTLGLLPVGVAIPDADFNPNVAGGSVQFFPTPGSVVTLSQTSIDFGSQTVGTASAPSMITLTNTNTVNPLVISQITIQGANAGDFTEMDNCTNLPVGLPPEGKCTINITFSPGSGQRSGTLSITDNGGDSPQIVPLSGTGT